MRFLFQDVLLGCFVRAFCSRALSFVLFVCFVGAVVLVLLDGFVRALALSLCFVRMFFWGRPLKCFVRVRGLKTSVRALHHTLCSEHEN